MAHSNIQTFHRYLDSQLGKPDTDPLETEFINRSLGRYIPRVYRSHIYQNQNRNRNRNRAFDTSQNIRPNTHLATKFTSVKVKSQIERDSKCVICLSDCNDMIDPVYLPCCRNKQIACRMCIKQSIDTNGNSCPSCRQDMISLLHSRK